MIIIFTFIFLLFYGSGAYYFGVRRGANMACEQLNDFFDREIEKAKQAAKDE